MAVYKEEPVDGLLGYSKKTRDFLLTKKMKPKKTFNQTQINYPRCWYNFRADLEKFETWKTAVVSSCSIHHLFTEPRPGINMSSNLHSSMIENLWEEHVGVSKNRDTPKSSILIGCSIINPPFWDTPIFGNTHVFLVSCFWQKFLLNHCIFSGAVDCLEIWQSTTKLWLGKEYAPTYFPPMGLRSPEKLSSFGKIPMS